MRVAPRTAGAAASACGNRASAKENPTVRSNPVESVAKVLSQRCRELPEMIGREKPDSVAGFAELSGRSRSNPSRRPGTMPRRGLLEPKRGGRGAPAPRVARDRVRLDASPTRPHRRIRI